MQLCAKNDKQTCQICSLSDLFRNIYPRLKLNTPLSERFQSATNNEEVKE